MDLLRPYDADKMRAYKVGIAVGGLDKGGHGKEQLGITSLLFAFAAMVAYIRHENLGWAAIT